VLKLVFVILGLIFTGMLRTLMGLGLITVQQRYVGGDSFSFEPKRGRRVRDVVDVYVPVLQPIPKRPPDGVNLPRLRKVSMVSKWYLKYFCFSALSKSFGRKFAFFQNFVTPNFYSACEKFSRVCSYKRKWSGFHLAYCPLFGIANLLC